MPILSICIPTYNRADYLKKTLRKLTDEMVFRFSEDVEIVISDNNSSDDTQEVCAEYKKIFGNKIVYHKQSENIKDKNFAAVLNLANGTYAKLNNDNLIFKKGELAHVVDFLKNKEHEDIILFLNGSNKLS